MSGKIVIDEYEQLEQLVREARPLLKDLKQAKKEADKILMDIIPNGVREAIDEQMKTELDRIAQAIPGQIEMAAERVMNEFDKLSAELMGVTAAHRKRGLPSMQKVIEEAIYRAMEDEVIQELLNNDDLAEQAKKEFGLVVAELVERRSNRGKPSVQNDKGQTIRRDPKGGR